MVAVTVPDGRQVLPVIVYTQGKSASTTVEAALQAAGLVCHKVHTLDRSGLLQIAGAAVAAGRFPPRHVCTAMAWRDGLITRPGACRFVTLVRDPVAQALSAFFENLFRRTDGLTRDSPPDVLIARFLAEAAFPGRLTWFDREFRDQLGIDVMAAPFEAGKRFRRLPRHGLVVLRTDCPDPVKSRVLSQMSGRPIQLADRNIGAAKNYAAAYADVTRRITLPADLSEWIYHSAYMRHFWTDEERARLCAWWTDPAQGRAEGRRDPF